MLLNNYTNPCSSRLLKVSMLDMFFGKQVGNDCYIPKVLSISILVTYNSNNSVWHEK